MCLIYNREGETARDRNQIDHSYLIVSISCFGTNTVTPFRRYLQVEHHSSRCPRLSIMYKILDKLKESAPTVATLLRGEAGGWIGLGCTGFRFAPATVRFVAVRLAETNHPSIRAVVVLLSVSLSLCLSWCLACWPFAVELSSCKWRS